MPDDPFSAFQAFKASIDAIKLTLEALRLGKDMLPDSDQKAKAEEALVLAYTSAEQATALLAVQLEFKLCKCEFPGTPMTFVRHDPTTGQEIVKCPKCDTEYPPELERIQPPKSGATWGT